MYGCPVRPGARVARSVMSLHGLTPDASLHSLGLNSRCRVHILSLPRIRYDSSAWRGQVSTKQGGCPTLESSAFFPHLELPGVVLVSSCPSEVSAGRDTKCHLRPLRRATQVQPPEDLVDLLRYANGLLAGKCLRTPGLYRPWIRGVWRS